MAEPIANTETDVRLDYAPLDAARRRRRLRRVLCAVGLVALIVAGAWLGPALWRGARVMYAVRYALGYDAALGPSSTATTRLPATAGRSWPARCGPGARAAAWPWRRWATAGCGTCTT